MNRQGQIKCLLDILYDKDAREDERDDAIMDLDNYNNPEVENAFVFAALNLTLSEMLLASIGESLAYIWIRKNKINEIYLMALPSIAKREAFACLSNLAPSLLEGFHNNLHQAYEKDISSIYKKLICKNCLVKNRIVLNFNFINKATIIEKNQSIFICKKCNLIWLNEADIPKKVGHDYKDFMLSLGLKGSWEEVKIDSLY